MKPQRSYSVLLGLTIAVGVILQLSTVRHADKFGLFVVFVFVWGLSPYLALLAAPRLTRGPAEVVAASIATVVPDFVMRVGVETSTSSTAPIAFIFIPFYLLVFFVPLGVCGVRFVFWVREHLRPGGWGA
jgi:hypothetical protein